MKEEYKATKLGDIPINWAIVKLVDITEQIKDGTHATHKEVEGGIPLLSAKDIRNGRIHVPSNCRKLSLKDFNSIHKNFKLKDGDLLLTVVGSIGRVAIIENYHNNYTFQRSVGYIRFDNQHSPHYFKHYFQSPFFVNQLTIRSNASAQAGVYLGELGKIPVLSIPLAEQQKIAEILSTIDAKIEVIDQQISETQELKKGLMQRLLSKGIGHTVFKDSPLGKIPKCWEVLKMGDLLEFKNGLNKGKEFFGKGIPIVNYMDVFRNQALTKEMLKGKVDVDESEIERFNVKKGDVFFTRTSETIEEIGYSACFVGDIKDAVFSGFVLRARPINDKLDLYFKKYCFDSYLTRKEIISKSTMTTRALTNGTVLSNVQILLPPIKEQQKIADILGSVDDKIELLSEKKTNYQELKQGLMQQLLTGKVRVQLNTNVSA